MAVSCDDVLSSVGMVISANLAWSRAWSSVSGRRCVTWDWMYGRKPLMTAYNRAESLGPIPMMAADLRIRVTYSSAVSSVVCLRPKTSLADLYLSASGDWYRRRNAAMRWP